MLQEMARADKPLAWLHGEIKTPPFSADARLEAGVLLRRLQRGERSVIEACRRRLDAYDLLTRR